MSTTEPDPDDDIVVRPFADWLREQAKGATHEELGDGLHDLIARVRDTGKAGSLQLTISVKLLEKANPDGPLLIADEIKLRLPEHDRPTSIFYTDSDGNPVRNDPQQLAFESLREVPSNVDPVTGEIKEARS
jgi:hypothetical protein